LAYLLYVFIIWIGPLLRTFPEGTWATWKACFPIGAAGVAKERVADATRVVDRIKLCILADGSYVLWDGKMYEEP
jgi:hypothetical protein